ncbi:hypothetical protein PRIPAC_84703 [Pristionchus pacificus]|uniref:Uncharacterized protein n=1 Tax=Pristionchus pacificus TaxID=54126 RepID=A0A2A6BWH2_PRIPA|nr:hypothetical protein PRIPAC_84703 [Pristionchus pacificus]|eukprot:PDM70111.1 hypothetical protein PRIPAC_43851 [Pristionchus pacificus]
MNHRRRIDTTHEKEKELVTPTERREKKKDQSGRVYSNPSLSLPIPSFTSQDMFWAREERGGSLLSFIIILFHPSYPTRI